MPFDIVASKFGFTGSMIIAGRETLLNTDYQLTLIPFDDYEVVNLIEKQCV